MARLLQCSHNSRFLNSPYTLETSLHSQVTQGPSVSQRLLLFQEAFLSWTTLFSHGRRFLNLGQLLCCYQLRCLLSGVALEKSLEADESDLLAADFVVDAKLCDNC